MSPTAKQAQRAAKKERHRRAQAHRKTVDAARVAHARLAIAEQDIVWPEPPPETPAETVCDGCGFRAIVLQDPHHEHVTPCLLCGSETAHYAEGAS